MQCKAMSNTLDNVSNWINTDETKENYAMQSDVKHVG